MDKFDMLSYISEIRAIATANKVSDSTAVGMFVTNLNVMKPYYSGAPYLDFMRLGQAWGSLLYTEKNSQRAAALEAIKKTAVRDRGRNREE